MSGQSLIIRRVKRYLKQWHEGSQNARPPCYDHCPKSRGCKKLFAHRKILEEIEETFQPRLDKDIREARERVRRLYMKMLRARGNIKSCIYIKKKLAEKGYRTWI